MAPQSDMKVREMMIIALIFLLRELSRERTKNGGFQCAGLESARSVSVVVQYMYYHK